MTLIFIIWAAAIGFHGMWLRTLGGNTPREQAASADRESKDMLFQRSARAVCIFITIFPERKIAKAIRQKRATE